MIVVTCQTGLICPPGRMTRRTGRIADRGEVTHGVLGVGVDGPIGVNVAGTKQTLLCSWKVGVCVTQTAVFDIALVVKVGRMCESSECCRLRICYATRPMYSDASIRLRFRRVAFHTSARCCWTGKTVENFSQQSDTILGLCCGFDACLEPCIGVTVRSVSQR